MAGKCLPSLRRRRRLNKDFSRLFSLFIRGRRTRSISGLEIRTLLRGLSMRRWRAVPNPRLQRTRAALLLKSVLGERSPFGGDRRAPLGRQPLGTDENQRCYS